MGIFTIQWRSDITLQEFRSVPNEAWINVVLVTLGIQSLIRYRAGPMYIHATLYYPNGSSCKQDDQLRMVAAGNHKQFGNPTAEAVDRPATDILHPLSKNLRGMLDVIQAFEI